MVFFATDLDALSNALLCLLYAFGFGGGGMFMIPQNLFADASPCPIVLIP